jgi:hypothetical protein
MKVLGYLKIIFIFIFLSISCFYVPHVQAQNTAKTVQIKLKEVVPVDGQKIKATIEWDTAQSGEHYYEIFSKTGSGDYSSLGNLAASPLVLTFAEDRQFFTIKVREVTAAGAGDFSNEVTVSWTRSTLSAPANVTIQKQAAANNTIEATIKWDSVSRATKYNVYTFFDGNKQKIGESPATESKVSFGKYGSNFAIAVSAANEFTESEVSAMAGVEREQYVNPTNTPAPTSKIVPELTTGPANLRILSQKIENDKKNIEIIWDSLPNSPGYYVYISTKDEFTKLSGVTLNSVIISVPVHFISFKIAVKGVNEKGESPLSNALEIKDEETKIEIQLKDDMVVSPVLKTSSTPIPAQKDVLKKIEIKETKPKDQPVSILGVNVKSDLAPNIEIKKKDESFGKKIASFFSSIVTFFTSWWK